jgi:DNA-directed RNA polymerase specialized sigma24 family protein
VVKANENGGAVRFLGSVLAGVIKDRYRRAKVRPRAAKHSGHDGDDDPYARIAAPVPAAAPSWDDQAALLEDLLDRARGEVDERIADSGKSAEHRQSASNYAEATLMARIRNMDSKEIARELGVPDTKSDTIAKWVERGRPWVLDALDALATDSAAEEAQALAKLRDLVAKLRKDAGVARPDRKRGGRR